MIGIPMVIDYNRDGLNDIIVHTQTSSGGQVHCLLNTGGYTFATQLLFSYTGSFLAPFCAIDLDNDGDIDIARYSYTNPTSQLLVHENQAGSFVVRSIGGLSRYLSLACTDINSDGFNDIITATDDDTTVAFMNPKSGWAFNTLSLSNPTPTQCHPPAFKAGKLSFLSYPNVIVAACWSGLVKYIYYDGSALKMTQVGGNYNSIGVGCADFNNDGINDIVAAGINCWNANSYTYSSGTWTSNNLPVSYGCSSRSLASAGDLDGNKFGDIITAGNYEVKIIWNSGSGSSVETLGTFSSTSVYFDFPIYTTAKLYNNALGNEDLLLNNGGSTISIFTTCKQCASCPAGSYVNGAGVCSACADSYSSAAGSKSCYRVCSAGLYGSYPSCTECPAGSFSSQGAAACTKCAANQVSQGGSKACQTCPANTYPVNSAYCNACPYGTSASAGSVSCTPCPFGSVRGCNDATCVACPAGTYANKDTCTQCVSGTFASSAAASCSNCPSGYYSDAGASACSACPGGYSSSSANTFCYLA